MILTGGCLLMLITTASAEIRTPPSLSNQLPHIHARSFITFLLQPQHDMLRTRHPAGPYQVPPALLGRCRPPGLDSINKCPIYPYTHTPTDTATRSVTSSQQK
jgi:hypothetical protein